MIYRNPAKCAIARFLVLLVIGLGLLRPAASFAASKSLKPGQILGVSEDIVLSGDDVLEVHGTAERPCRLDANGQQIRTHGDWQRPDQGRALRVPRSGQPPEAGPRST